MSGPSPRATIDVRGAKKRFGSVEALAGMDINVHPREVVCILGPNSAGKTTLFRAILGLEALDAGEVSLFDRGHRPDTPATRERIGYAPEIPPVEPRKSGFANVASYAQLMGCPRHQAHKRARTVLARVGLAGALGRRVDGYSKGMRQRLNLARAIVHDPDLVLLDEPCSGLDPSGREEVRDLVVSLKDEGKTVLLASHDVQDAARASDRVVIVNAGKAAWTGQTDTAESLTNRFKEVVGDGTRPVVFLPP